MHQDSKVEVSDMLWWEKTVEYAFVRNIMPLEYLAAPLAGDAEKFFGDLMNENSKGEVRLIEFKRTFASIKDEVLKYYAKGEVPKGTTFYDAWIDAVGAIECNGRLGHWFVYGDTIKEGNKFQLKACQYGPKDTDKFVLERDDQLSYVSPKDLSCYMHQLMPKRTRGGGWSGAMVVAKLDGKSLVMNAQEFIDRKINLEPTVKISRASTLKRVKL